MEELDLVVLQATKEHFCYALRK